MITDHQVSEVKRLLWDVTHGIRNHTNAVLVEATGLTLPQLIVLKLVNEQRRSPTSSEIVDKVGLARSTVSGIIKRLERDGLLRKVEDPSDLRVYRLVTTEKAKGLLLTTDSIHDEYMRSVLAVFKDQELEAFISMLAKFRGAIDGHS